MKWIKENKCVPDEILQQFIDGELEQKEAVLVEKHLSECKICQSNIREKRIFINQLSDSLNIVDEDNIEIPEFKLKKTEAVEFQTKRRVYWWSAAAVILMLISFFLIKNSADQNVNLEYVFQEMNDEIDANKPWHEQTTTIYILNESGEIIDKFENL